MYLDSLRSHSNVSYGPWKWIQQSPYFEALTAFGIQRPLSEGHLTNLEQADGRKGCPYDNTVAEIMFTLKPRAASLEVSDYVHWFNHHRIHGTLDYRTPVKTKRWLSKLLSS